MPHSDATDDDLLTARDAASFEQFSVRHVDAVLGYFARRTRDPELASDLCAETFAAALASRHHRSRRCTYLIPGGPGLLMLVGGGRLSALDPGDGRTLWTASFEAPTRFWAPGGEDTLWVYLVRSPELRDRVVRLDAGSGRRTGHVDVPEPGAAGLANVGRELWAASPDGKITVVR